jgi:hypothetical protein
MLYIAEVPWHFGFTLVICAASLLLALFSLFGLARKGKDATVSAFAGFLSVLFVFLTFLLLAISQYLLPATATVVELFPYYLGAWSFVGLHAFFLVFFLLGTEYFAKRVWAIFLPVLGTLSYLVCLWILATPGTVVPVTDGVLNYLGWPLVLLVYAGVLVALYMVVLPIYVTYTLAKQRRGPQKLWTWLVWVAYLVWVIAAMLFAAIQFTYALGLLALGLGGLAWVLILVTYYLLDRQMHIKPKAAAKPKPKPKPKAKPKAKAKPKRKR